LSRYVSRTPKPQRRKPETENRKSKTRDPQPTTRTLHACYSTPPPRSYSQNSAPMLLFAEPRSLTPNPEIKRLNPHPHTQAEIRLRRTRHGPKPKTQSLHSKFQSQQGLRFPSPKTAPSSFKSAILIFEWFYITTAGPAVGQHFLLDVHPSRCERCGDGAVRQ